MASSSNNPDLKGVPSSIQEGKARITTTCSFYNPHMKFCRDLYTLAFQALPEKSLAVLDGFAASGIRGIRYALEGGKDLELVLLDIDQSLKPVLEQNVTQNSVKAEIQFNDFNRYTRTCGKRFDFVEIDPFGSALPFLDSGLYSLGKGGYLSVTATDTQVLCGSNSVACRRYYGSRSLNNFLCHELGLRILLSTISRKAAEQNKGITPLLSISHRHYLKTICKVERGSKKTDCSLSQIGMLQFCQSCLFFSKFAMGDSLLCPECGKKTMALGPLWLGNLNDQNLISRMQELASKKDYLSETEQEEILKSLSLYKNDDLSLLFRDVHEFCKAHCLKLRKNSEVVSALQSKGFTAAVCSFSTKGVKGNFGHKDFLKALAP